MKKLVGFLFLVLMTALSGALFACDDVAREKDAAKPEHVHESEIYCDVDAEDRSITLGYSCDCGADASSLTVRLTGHSGEVVCLAPDDSGKVDCYAYEGEFSVEVLLGETSLYGTQVVFKPTAYYQAVEGYEYTDGEEIEKIEYWSSVAGAYKHANVVLPPDYDPEKSYPVLYLLHGLQCNEDSWVSSIYGLYEMNAQYIVQNAHYFDGAPEMIVVCVNSLVNATETEPEWSAVPPSAPPELAQTYDLTGRDITECLMPYINEHYSTLTGKRNTAIAGFSMGGREAVLTAFAYQDVFGYVGAFSSASFGENVVSSSTYVPDFTLDEGSDGFRYVQITVGMLDTLAPVSSGICDKLDAIGVEYTYESVFGMHDPSVWRGALKTFVQNIFR